MHRFFSHFGGGALLLGVLELLWLCNVEYFLFLLPPFPTLDLLSPYYLFLICLGCISVLAGVFESTGKVESAGDVSPERGRRFLPFYWCKRRVLTNLAFSLYGYLPLLSNYLYYSAK